MNHKLSLIALILLLAISACKPSIPDEYIQPGELTDMLYEYHLAQAMSAQGGGDRDMVAYKAAILNKYGYTQTQFDSTLYYYVRHTKLMHDVYERLSDRLSKEAIALGASANDVNHLGGDDVRGDTANIWTGQRSIVLMTGKTTCLSTFSLKVDTTYHAGDKLMLNFDADFIYQEGIRDGVAVLTVRFANDSVAQQVCHVSSSSNYSLTVDDYNRLGIKSVKGFFLLNDNGQTATTMRIMVIRNVRLIRMHQKPVEPEAPADSSRQSAPPVATPQQIQRTSLQVGNNQLKMK